MSHQPIGEAALQDWRAKRWAPSLVCVIAYAAAFAVAAATVMLLSGQHPILSALAADVAATLVVFAAARLVDNSSVYDPYWSVVPPILLLFWMGQPASAEALTGREALVLGLVLLWAVRLTWNCMARWKSLAEEDFRYRDLRARAGSLYPLVDLAGIQLFPTLLVFLGCLALYPVTLSQAPLGALDALAAAVTLAGVAIEALADRQLARFQKANQTPGKVCDIGLWRWSQHPNYFGELTFWWGLWLFALAADPAWWWTVVGPIAMTALFSFISIPMMLRRKRARRPDYDAQTAGVSVLIPWPPRRR